MKTTYITLITLTSILSFNACDKENSISKPRITITELGYENSKTATQGTDLHIEAEVIAEGKIKTILVIVHPEGEHSEKSVVSDIFVEEWKFDSVYTKFSGLRNTTFHEDLDIPLTAATGNYHFDFIVTDMDGNQTSAEDEVEILIAENPEIN